MHVLILGITDTGKTTLAFKIAAMQKAQGRKVLVLDPDIRSAWNADFITDDPEYYLATVKLNKSCALFIDEGGQMIGRYAGAMQWLATNSRKWGHKAHFIAQRATQLDKTIRTQCTNLFLFKQSVGDCKVLSDEFVCHSLMSAYSLKKGEFFCKCGVDGEMKKGKAW
jgi:hypothetical protein